MQVLISRCRLRVAGVLLSDAGEYTCETERSGGLLEVSRHRVEVISRPEVTISGAGDGVLSVKAGSRLRLVCRGEGRPRPAVSWWRDGKMISRSLIARSVLHLQEISAREAGQMTCKADNGVMGPVSEAVYLNVLSPPTVTISSTLTSCSLEVTCTASTSTPGRVRMMYSGQEVLSDNLQQGPGLSAVVSSHQAVVDICRQEGSEVSCQVENRLGRVQERLLVSRQLEVAPPLPLLSSGSSPQLPLLLLLVLACFLFDL